MRGSAGKGALGRKPIACLPVAACLAGPAGGSADAGGPEGASPEECAWLGVAVYNDGSSAKHDAGRFRTGRACRRWLGEATGLAKGRLKAVYCSAPGIGWSGTAGGPTVGPIQTTPRHR